MRILVKGASGLIGTHLSNHLLSKGHELIRVVRDPLMETKQTILWNPEHAPLQFEAFEGFDAIINLGGENIASSRWTPEKKKKIRNSRVTDSHMLAELVSSLKHPPKVFINASAIGYYGNRGDTLLDEGSAPGNGFLAEVCEAWEKATEPAQEKNVRVANLRIGIVLSKKGGALSRMLTPFKFGLGGKIGSGKQWMSWISIEDVSGAIIHILNTPTISGPINLTAPEPATSAVFTKTLGTVLRRPTIFPIPACIIRLLFGEMGEALLLSSTRAIPKKLCTSGYQFRHPKLKEALQYHA